MTDDRPANRSAIVAANIRAEISRRRITQLALAQRLGMSPASMSSRLTGQTPIDVNELDAIASELGLPIAALIEDAA